MSQQPRKEYRPREEGTSSSASLDAVEVQECDSEDTSITLEDWDDWFAPGPSTPVVKEPGSGSDNNFDSHC